MLLMPVVGFLPPDERYEDRRTRLSVGPALGPEVPKCAIGITPNLFQNRIGNALVSYAAYLGQALWPIHLTVLYPLEWKSLPVWQPIGAAVSARRVTNCCHSKAVHLFV